MLGPYQCQDPTDKGLTNATHGLHTLSLLICSLSPSFPSVALIAVFMEALMLCKKILMIFMTERISLLLIALAHLCSVAMTPICTSCLFLVSYFFLIEWGVVLWSETSWWNLHSEQTQSAIL